MKTLRHRRFLSRTSALTLALAALAPLPRLLAQAPAPPPAATSADGKAFEAIVGLTGQEKWVEAMKAGEAFLAQFKEQSPKSRDVHYLLALAYLHQEKMQDDAVRELRKLLPDKNVAPEVKEQAQLLIAKAFTMKGIGMSDETEAQRKVRDAIYDDAIKAYDAYLATYPKSRSGDTAYFLSGILTLEVKRYEDAVKRFGTVYQNYAKSPLRSDALLNVGKTFLIQANDLMTAPPGKDAKPEDVQKGLDILNANALPALSQVFRDSGDLAILNEAQGYIGQIRLTQSQHVTEPDEAKRKKAQQDSLLPALDAFRAVRSIEEVIVAQDAKIKSLQDKINQLAPGTAEYLPYKSYYENLINVEADKKEKLKTGSDQYLAARVAIARIFLFLGKYDECRVLIRYLQGQKELFAKDKEAEAAVNALLTHTYIGQNNLEKTVESYEAFRTAYKGNEAGEDLPLFTANLVVEKGKAEKAEEIVNQGLDDYKAAHNGTGWQFATDAVRILIRVALDKSDFQKALDLCEKVLATSPKPEVEMETLYIKGTVQEEMGIKGQSPAVSDQAYETFKLVRDKFATSGKAEDAWFRQCQILAGKDPAKAQIEISKYIDTFAGGSGKSENTKNNLGVNQYTLGKVLDMQGQADKAVAAFRKLIDTYPDNEVTPDAYFRIRDIEDKRKNAPGVLKAMQEYIQKYPTNKNIYYAYNFIAELHFSGMLSAPVGKDGKPGSPNPTTADREAGSKKLMEYVDYELEKKLEPPHGESALLRVGDVWLKQLSSLGTNFELLPNDQKLTWQKSADGVLGAVEKHLKSYPQGERLPEALERAVKVQGAMVKARQTDMTKGEAYFRDLISKYGAGKETKSKVLVALAAFMSDVDAKRAAAIRKEARDLVPEALKKAGPDGGEERVVASFAPGDWDKQLGDLFEEKKYDEMTKMVARVRTEYPASGEDVPATGYLVKDAQAVALFWEAKVLDEQGKVTEAGVKLNELITKYPKTTKKMEADYGVINGKFVGGQLKTEIEQRAAIKRLTEIIGVTTSKTFELQAKSLFLIGQIYEEMKDFDSAIAAYAKVATSFGSVPKVAGDGLWKAATLLERQASKEIPVKLPAELAASAKAKAAADAAAKKAAEAKEPATAKPGEVKPGDPKAGTPAGTAAKPGDAKPGDKKPADPKAAAKPTTPQK